LRDGESSTSVNVRLPDTEYDRVYRESRVNRMSVPEVLRRANELASKWQSIAEVRGVVLDDVLAGQTARLAEVATADEFVDDDEAAAYFAASLQRKAEELGLFADAPVVVPKIGWSNHRD
jgi:hypothetical protein